ncbi:Uncharacterised protein [Bordetella pertussis]|nr:Uncharacterised protein [Bordetella pertussis]
MPQNACSTTSNPLPWLRLPTGPKPEMAQYTRRGLISDRASQSTPSFCATPGPKLWTTTSAQAASRCTTARPCADFRSSAMLRLLRLQLRNTAAWPSWNGGQPRVSSPCPAASTLITSAPMSAMYCVHSGPARTLDRSSTRTPPSGVGGTEEETAAMMLD